MEVATHDGAFAEPTIPARRTRHLSAAHDVTSRVTLRRSVNPRSRHARTWRSAIRGPRRVGLPLDELRVPVRNSAALRLPTTSISGERGSSRWPFASNTPWSPRRRPRGFHVGAAQLTVETDDPSGEVFGELPELSLRRSASALAASLAANRAAAPPRFALL